MEPASAISQTAQRPASCDDAGVPAAATRAGSRRWVIGVVALSVGVRLIGVTQPLVGTFATKHCVYAMIARNWAEGRASFWQPTVDCLTGDGRALHLMEWPASAWVAASGYRVFGGDLDLWGRAVSIFCMAAATLLAYRFARRKFGESAARATSLVVGFAPVGIIYGRGFMLEPSLVLLSFVTIYAWDLWLETRRTARLATASVALALAVVTKIYMLLLVAPLAALLFSSSASPRPRVSASSFLSFLVATVPFVPVAVWYYGVYAVAPSDEFSAQYHPAWHAAKHTVPHPLLLEASYYAVLFRNLATVVLTPLGLLLAAIGLFGRRERWLMAWVAACGSAFILMPLKFQVADYYFLPLLPPAALLVGVGWQRFAERLAPSPRLVAAAVACSLLIAARFTIGPTWRLHEEDRAVTAAAHSYGELATDDESVVAIHGSTLDLLYYCDRPGWALDAADPQLPEKLAAAERRGATRLVVVHPAHLAANGPFQAWLNSRPPERSGADWQIYRLARLGPSDAATTTAESPPHPAPRTATR